MGRILESEKSPVIADFLENFAGRSTAIREDKCVKAPIGCGKTIVGFKDQLSLKEYSISGLCQECQDKIFGDEYA